MKNILQYIIGTTVGVFLGISITIAAIIGLGALTVMLFQSVLQQTVTSEFPKDYKSVYFRLEGEIVEKTSQIDQLFSELPPALGGGAPRLGLYDLQQALLKAKEDKKIKGLYLRLDDFSAGWVTLKNLRGSLLDFKQSGKFIVAFAEQIDEAGLYLISVADQIYLHPQGNIEWNGFEVVPSFVQGTLEKLKIQPRIFRTGKYKSAVEIFSNKSMSKESREQYQEIIYGLWNEIETAIGQQLSIDKSKLDEWAQNMSIRTPQQALEHQLITGLKPEHEVLTEFYNKIGSQKENPEDFVSLLRYVRGMSSLSTLFRAEDLDEESGPPVVAVIFIDGQITMGQSAENGVGADTIAAAIRKARRSPRVKAVVIRINSPGGSALASDIIWSELQRLAKEKKVYASFGDIVASGGYYIAAGAEKIFADSASITGSIGVFGVLFDMQSFFNEHIGMTFDRVVTHPHADFGSAVRPMPEKEQAFIQDSIEKTYSQFLNVVDQGRSNLSLEEIKKRAGGRVYIGSRAKELGLIDDYANLPQTLQKIQEDAQLKDAQIVILPYDQSMQQFLSSFSFWAQAKMPWVKILNQIMTDQRQDTIRTEWIDAFSVQ